MPYSSSNPTDDTLKGLRRLRFRRSEDSLPEVQHSIYRWWWEFLQLSKDYWLVCQTSERQEVETSDAALRRVYRAFGNIHTLSFEEWWLERGHRVFRERVRFPKVQEVARHSAERPMQTPLSDRIWVDIPLKLSRRTIQRQLGKILDQYDAQRLNNRLELSTSEFRINPVLYRLHTLQLVHETHCLHRELVDKPNHTATKKSKSKRADYGERADLFRIGSLLSISPSNERLTGDAQEIFKKQNRMRASVSRMLNRANLLITNVELGVFPNFKPNDTPSRRFTSRQLAMHQEIEDQWWQLTLGSELSIGKLEAAKQIHYAEQLKTRQTL